MEVRLETEKERLYAHLRGEIDHHSAAGLRQEIDGAVSRCHAKALFLDFSGITFMDSSGIGLILGRYKLMQSRGGTLTVCGVSPRQMQVMRMAGLEKLHILQEERTEKNESNQ